MSYKCKKWRDANKEKVKQQNKRYREKHKEQTIEYCRNKYQRDPQAVKDRVRKWREENRERHNLQNHLWRARRKNAEGTCSFEEWVEVKMSYGNKCIDCETTEGLTIGHLVPISKGGTNWPSNLAPQCQSCNSKQGTKIHSRISI